MRRGTRVALVAAAGALAVGAAYGVWHVVKAPDGPPEPAIAQGSPFECGFVFDTQSYDAPHLTVTGTAWTTPARSVSVGDNSGDIQWTNGTIDMSGNSAHGVVKESFKVSKAFYGVWGGIDPADAAVRAEQGGDHNGPQTGVTFVSVRDGKVVGTLGHDAITGGSLFAVTGIGDGRTAGSVGHLESAFDVCPGEQPSDVGVEVYFVASVVNMKSGDPNPVGGPEYAWSNIETLRGDVASNDSSSD